MQLIDIDHTTADDGSKYWSGHWLRWKDRCEGQLETTDDPEKCPSKDTWEQIRQAKQKHGAPPAYFAVLVLDGDDMGTLARTADEAKLSKVSATLAHFALSDVCRIVEGTSHGKLVYAGGDDVLALLPTSCKRLAPRRDKRKTRARTGLH